MAYQQEQIISLSRYGRHLLRTELSFSLNRDSSKIKKERPGIPNTGLPRRSAFHF